MATKIARQQAARSARSVSIATASLAPGTVTESNTGHRCTSGTLLIIKVTGQWNVTHAFLAKSESASPSEQTIIVRADPQTGSPCLISFAPQGQPPDPGATVLFKT